MTAKQKKYVIFSVLAAVVIALDQWTKALAREVLRPLPWGQTKTVVANYFDLRYSENTGVAFGMLQSLPGGRIVLTVVAIVAFIAVLGYLRNASDEHRTMHVALGLIGGGAIGNLLDRIIYGRVTDFIVWHYYKDFEWPAFNIADAALVIGVGLLAVDWFRFGRRAATATPATAGGEQAEKNA